MTDHDQMKQDALWEEHGDHRVSPYYDEYTNHFDPDLPEHVMFCGQVVPCGDATTNTSIFANYGETELNMESAFALRCVAAVVEYTEDNDLWEDEV